VNSFFGENLGGENVRSVSQALEKISLNINWLTINEKKVFGWLKSNAVQDDDMSNIY